MNIDEIFSKVANHLLKQGEKSQTLDSDNDMICAYRGGDGLSCAVGCLIDDERYNFALEGVTISHPSVIYALRKSLKMETIHIELRYLLEDMQKIHDFSDVKDWEYCLDSLADTNKINWKRS